MSASCHVPTPADRVHTAVRTRRMVVVWCPDWSVAAADAPADAPVAVVHANQVVAASLAARAEGVEPGLRRRAAQARCPSLLLVPFDPARDARVFEVVLEAVECFTPLLELTEPGTVTFLARGPSRFHGGDVALGHQVSEVVMAVLGDRVRATGPPGVGIADGWFAATLAARRAAFEAVRAGPPRTSDAGHAERRLSLVVPPGGSATFLAPLSVSSLPDPALVGLLWRLGIRTLGQLAALPAVDVLGRFGAGGLEAHRAANGLDDRPPGARPPPPEFTVHQAFEPPVLESEPVVFAAKHLADGFLAELAQRGLVATTCLVWVETEHGERYERTWHHGPGFTPATLTERVRWQLEGWAQGPSGPEREARPSGPEQAERPSGPEREARPSGPERAERPSGPEREARPSGPEREAERPSGPERAERSARPTGGITALRLVPVEVVADVGRQLGFWGGDRLKDERAARATARLSGLLGPDAVTVPEWQGGRDPAESFVTVPAVAVDLVERAPVGPPAGTGPWPGRLPPPAPARVPAALVPAEVVDDSGRRVGVSGRGEATGAPAHLAVGAGAPRRVTAWAGPWLLDERWWDHTSHRRRARFQVVTEDGQGHLLVLAEHQWWVAATYD